MIVPASAGAIATLSPTVYDFGPVALGSSKTVGFQLSTSCPDDPTMMLFQCQEPQEGPLPVSISVSPGFSQTNNCPSMMPRVETVAACTILVTFAPNSLASSQGQVLTGSPMNGAPSSALSAAGAPEPVTKPAKRKCKKAGKRASASAKPKKCLRRKGKKG